MTGREQWLRGLARMSDADLRALAHQLAEEMIYTHDTTQWRKARAAGVKYNDVTRLIAAREQRRTRRREQ